ncbi:hypothetical protein [Salinisphaera hydrothermalis]|uniref:hypothetical protein n=1 Tax=Salinisphaera hydrothermalis TaxID=563188 RepID=UPI00333F35AB
MTPPGVLHYHHDRCDLRGAAVLAFLGGLVLLGIVLPVVHGAISNDVALMAMAAAVVLWLGVWGAYGRRARAARGREETVHFDDTGFESRLFGRVAFADVQQHATGRDMGLWRWEVSAPSLTLKLANRPRLHFHLDERHYRDDLLDYVAFIEATLAGIESKRHNATLPGRALLFDGPDTARDPAMATARTAREPATEATTRDVEAAGTRRRRARAARKNNAPADRASARQSSSAADLSRANTAARRRLREQLKKNSKWIALAGILLPLSYSIRACDPGWIKSIVDPSPFQGMAERAPVVLKQTTNQLQRAVAQKGPVYAWTHADNADLKPVLAPNINARHIGSKMLDMMSTANSITEFLINGEAEGYRMGVQHDGTLTLAPYSAISLQPMPGEHTLSFFLLAPKGVTAKDLGGRTPPQLSWRVRYRDAADIPDQLRQLTGQLPMPIIARWLKMTPAPRLVVAASRYQGMTDKDFQAAIDVVTQDLKRRGIDTDSFEIHRFADGTVDPPRAADVTRPTRPSNRSVAPDVVE